MDSISQIVLGSSVAYLVTGKQAPRLSLLAGAVVGTIPDLDFIVTYADALQSTVAHRTWSHSWLIQTAVSPLLAYAASLYLPKLNFKQWFWLIWLCLVTHTLLDCFTVYGTGALWPLPVSNIMQGSIFIIDPLYTLPLLFAVIVAWRRHKKGARACVITGLVLSCVYLTWGLSIQQSVKQRLIHQLEKQGILSNQLLVTPAPFNSLLWRVVAVQEDAYFEGLASILDADPTIDLKRYDRNTQHLQQLREVPSFNAYTAFSHNFYTLENLEGEVIIKDLRMGFSPYLLFQFNIARHVVDKVIATPPQFVDIRYLPMSRLKVLFLSLFRRIVDQQESIPEFSEPNA
ncbi:MAG: inner membrane protein [Saprospiraceae bacterium]|jgi:inner membrane protein